MSPPGGDGDGARPSPAGLDLAIAWLERNLDQLMAATGRSGQPSPGPAPGGSAAPARTGTAGAATRHPAGVTAATSADARQPTQKSAPRASQAASAAVPAPEAAPRAAGTGAADPTPLLDQIGRDLTRLAADGSLGPVIGREDETAWLIEVLLRSTKRDAILVGPAGVGKTAIVEGLAQRIVAGRVPAPLLGARIIEVPIASLTAGTQYRGQLEERLSQLVAEASRPGIILFLDEIHLVTGAGRTEGGMGAGEILKPALARGSLAVIGATTPEDYRAAIAPDDSFARRFTTVTVGELDEAASRPILRSVRDRLAASRGVTASDDALDVLLDFANRRIANRRFPDKAIDLLEQAVADAIVSGRTTVEAGDATATTERWAERASSTPTLERYGRDLVGRAREGKLGPIVGRDRELDAIVEVLLRKTKRNPLLLGPAGSGKTAVVEGLSIRIAAGTVPEPLRDVRVFEMPLLALAAAIATDPRVLTDLLVEVRHPSVVVFFDEIHLLAAPAVHDLAESLKPALARGEIACIGATTAEEYQANLESETALARRFTEIPIEPLDPVAVRSVLDAVRASLGKLRGVTVEDEALEELIDLADRFLPNRSFPDKGVDLIEQSVAYAITHDRSSVDVATARAAVGAMIGMPIDAAASVTKLASALREGGLLDPDAADALTGRLAVSLRGLDARRERPDGVVLLCGTASGAAGRLAATIARIVFGRETAVIDIDLAPLADDSSLSTLLGSAPGLIGSDRALPLHELRRSPWQTVVFRGIDQCALVVRDTIASALAAGAFTDAMGRRLPLGSTVVVLTAPNVATGAGSAPVVAELAARLGGPLLEACDAISGAAARSAQDARWGWIERELLKPLAARLARAGYPATFDPAFVDWLDASLPTDGTPPDAFIDREVTARLAPDLPAPGPIRISVRDGRPRVEPDAVATAATTSAPTRSPAAASSTGAP